MRKFILLILVLLILSFCSCENVDFNKNNPDDVEDLFKNFEISENDEYAYERSFNKAFTPEQYVNLISNLKTLMKEQSIEPLYMISKDLLFVKRTINTYDKFEEAIAIVNTNGEIVLDWNTDYGDYDIQIRAKCGDYFFAIKKGYGYGLFDCDVINKEGKIITTLQCSEKRYDIGNGYIFFSLGADCGHIMDSSGKVVDLQYKSVIPSYCQKSNGALDNDEEIGKISEGLFFGFSKGNVNTVAYYYNTNGEVVIDLSTQAVNFEVTKLSDFANGKANIEFIGANGKNYTAVIDKTGEFIGEPKEVTF